SRSSRSFFQSGVSRIWTTFTISTKPVSRGKEWIKKIVDLSKGTGESAAKNDALMALIKRTKTTESFWGAGIVPDEARASLKEDPRLAAAASMKDVYASIDVKNGFSLTGAIDL